MDIDEFRLAVLLSVVYLVSAVAFIDVQLVWISSDVRKMCCLDLKENIIIYIKIFDEWLKPSSQNQY